LKEIENFWLVIRIGSSFVEDAEVDFLEELVVLEEAEVGDKVSGKQLWRDR
jgi:hypothetical protein